MNNLLELYARCGKTLLDIGINEAALPISKIDEAINLFNKNNLLILGGDIYKKGSKGGFEFIYANWSYDSNDIQESILVARDYLEKFKEQDFYVVFVIKLLNQK